MALDAVLVVQDLYVPPALVFKKLFNTKGGPWTRRPATAVRACSFLGGNSGALAREEPAWEICQGSCVQRWPAGEGRPAPLNPLGHLGHLSPLLPCPPTHPHSPDGAAQGPRPPCLPGQHRERPSELEEASEAVLGTRPRPSHPECPCSFSM